MECTVAPQQLSLPQLAAGGKCLGRFVLKGITAEPGARAVPPASSVIVRQIHAQKQKREKG
jgi:hypothetical protein